MSVSKFSCARNFVIVALASVVLTGCLDDTLEIEPVQTVDWYQAHDDERQDTLKVCANNPGELKDDSNCINAREAERMLSSGEPRNIW